MGTGTETPLAGQGQAPQIETDRAHPARMYDYYLGGHHHSEADARAAEKVAAAMPVVWPAARANRDFMTRATRWLAGPCGVRQFLDIGSGIPTEPNLHQVAQAVAPDAKVLYSDSDPLVLRHGRELLRGAPESGTAYIHADVTDPVSILDAPELSDTIDLGRPVALSVNAVFHFIGDEHRPHEIVRTLLGALPAGSYLVLTHTTADFVDAARVEGATNALQAYADSGTPLRPRTRSEVTRFFEGLELLEPGLVVPHRWRPGPETPRFGDTEIPGYVGVARKP
ncbi:hypothetical protein GCM10012287_06620 [Streptomyces daqingensis]|uniref:S-adenosyl methyltransferase n=1 Tax=Streptomyces daqingensis TaxID=1472640 RepID=A0ABQ2LUN7_9ACTN|nr:hypothetical protein GCM10012287_06620 [Streptomyces daqingensis]